MFSIRTAALGAATLLASSVAAAACQNDVTLKTLTNAFPAYEIMTSEMQKCGNVSSELDKDHRLKLQPALSASPALYQIAGVANSSSVPLLDENLLRPLDDLVAKYGQELTPNQKIVINGKVMAVAALVNTQHIMYRKDIFDKLGLKPPANWDEVLSAAAKIKAAGVVDYPYSSYYKSGWNLGFVFINHYLGDGGKFFGDGWQPSINNAKGVAVLERMKKLAGHMDPEYLVADSTFVTKQFQQGKIAMGMLWASRAGAVNDEKESTVSGKIVMAAAPKGSAQPAATLWWDGWVVAKNTTDAEAEAGFKMIMNSMRPEVVKANNDAAVWLAKGFTPGAAAAGAAATAQAGAAPYPASKHMSALHNALGAGLSDYLTGAKDAATTLADIEAAYTKSAKESGLLK